MKFTPLALEGAVLIEPELKADARGHFARLWCAEEFRAAGLDTGIAQISLAYNRLEGTLRGLHYQAAPHEEVKLVRCTRGAAYDVVVDLREHSPTYLHWTWTELRGADHRMIYVPRGFAHGYQTLQDHTELEYQISAAYEPRAARGVRFDDPKLGIRWPLPVSAMSDRDRSWSLLASDRSSRGPVSS